MSITSTISNIFPNPGGIETEYTLTISGTVNGESVTGTIVPADGRYQAVPNNISFVSTGADEIITFKSSLITPDTVTAGTTIAVNVTSTSVNLTLNITVRDRVALNLNVNGVTIEWSGAGGVLDNDEELMGFLSPSGQEYYLPPNAEFSSITDKNTYTLVNPAINTRLILIEVTALIINQSLTDVKICTSRIIDMSHAFDEQFGNFDDSTIFIDFPTLDTSNVTNMSYAFSGFISTNINSFSYFNVSNVVNMDSTFAGANFNNDISTWDVSNVTTMRSMFNTSTFNQNINSWNVENVQDMTQMFNNASFDQPLNLWVTSSLLYMEFMFAENTSFNQSVDTFDVSNVTSLDGVFTGATAFNQPLNSWDVSNVVIMNGLFAYSSFDQPLNNWVVDKLTHLNDAFSYCPFNQNINGWNVSKLQTMSQTFTGNTAFNQPLNNWNTSALTNLWFTFSGATSFNQDISSWKVCNINTIGGFLVGATSFNQDLSSWTLPLVSAEPPSLPGFAQSSGIDGQTAKYPQWGASCSYFNAYSNLPSTFHIYLPATNFDVSQYFVTNGFPSDLTGIVFTLSDPNYTFNAGFVEPNPGAIPGTSEIVTVNYYANGGNYLFDLTAIYPASYQLEIDNTQVQNIDLATAYTPGTYTTPTYTIYSGTLPAGATLTSSTGNLNVPANNNLSGGDNFILQIEDGGSSEQTFVSLDWVYSTPLNISDDNYTYVLNAPYDLQTHVTPFLPAGILFGNLTIAANPTDDPFASYAAGDLTFQARDSGSIVPYLITVTLGSTPSTFTVSVTYNDTTLPTESYTIDKTIGDTIDTTTNLPTNLTYSSYALEAPVTDWTVDSNGILTIAPGGALTGATGTVIATTPEGYQVKVPLNVTYSTVLVIADDNITYTPGLTYDLQAYVTSELATNNPGVNYGDVTLTTTSGLNLIDKQNVPIPPSAVGTPVSYPIDATYLGDTITFNIIVAYPQYVIPTAQVETIDKIGGDTISFNTSFPGSLNYTSYNLDTPISGWTINPTTKEITVAAGAPFSGSGTANVIATTTEGFEVNLPIDYTYTASLSINNTTTLYDPLVPYDLEGYITSELPSVPGLAFGNLDIAPNPTDDSFASYLAGNLTFPPKTSNTVVQYLVTVTLGDTDSTFTVNVEYGITTTDPLIYNLDKSVENIITPTANIAAIGLSYFSYDLLAPVTDWTANVPSSGNITIAADGDLSASGSATFVAYTADGYEVHTPIIYAYGTALPLLPDDPFSYTPNMIKDLSAFLIPQINSLYGPVVQYSDIQAISSPDLTITDPSNVSIPAAAVGSTVNYQIDLQIGTETTSYNLQVSYPQATVTGDVGNVYGLTSFNPKSFYPDMNYNNHIVTPPLPGASPVTSTGIMQIYNPSLIPASGSFNLLATTIEGFEVLGTIDYRHILPIILADTPIQDYGTNTTFDLQSYITAGINDPGLVYSDFGVIVDPQVPYSNPTAFFPLRYKYDIVDYPVTVSFNGVDYPFNMRVQYSPLTSTAPSQELALGDPNSINMGDLLPLGQTSSDYTLLTPLSGEWSIDPVTGVITIAPGNTVPTGSFEVLAKMDNGNDIVITVPFTSGLFFPSTTVQTTAEGDPSEVVDYINNQLLDAGTGLTIDDFTVTINGEPYGPGYTLPENPGGTILDLEIVMTGPYNYTFSMKVAYPFDRLFDYLSIIATVGNHNITTGEPNVTDIQIKERVVETLKSMLRVKMGFKYIFSQVDDLVYPFFDPVLDTIVSPTILLTYLKQGIVNYKDLKTIDKFIYDMFPLLANFFKHMYKFYDNKDSLNMNIANDNYTFNIII